MITNTLRRFLVASSVNSSSSTWPRPRSVMSCALAGLVLWLLSASSVGAGPKAPAPVPATGAPTLTAGDDGDLQAGVALPTPRFRDNRNGTVTDLLTGLVWLQNSACGTENWWGALARTRELADGQCGLTDRSDPGDWRLANLRELESLLDYRFLNPMLSNTAGTGQATAGDPFLTCGTYWTSTYFREPGAVVLVDITRLYREWALVPGMTNYQLCWWPVRNR